MQVQFFFHVSFQAALHVFHFSNSRFSQNLREDDVKNIREAAAHKTCRSLSSSFEQLLTGTILSCHHHPYSAPSPTCASTALKTVQNHSISFNHILSLCNFAHCPFKSLGAKGLWLQKYRSLRKVQKTQMKAKKGPWTAQEPVKRCHADPDFRDWTFANLKCVNLNPIMRPTLAKDQRQCLYHFSILFPLRWAALLDGVQPSAKPYAQTHLFTVAPSPVAPRVHVGHPFEWWTWWRAMDDWRGNTSVFF